MSLCFCLWAWDMKVHLKDPMRISQLCRNFFSGPLISLMSPINILYLHPFKSCLACSWSKYRNCGSSSSSSFLLCFSSSSFHFIWEECTYSSQNSLDEKRRNPTKSILNKENNYSHSADSPGGTTMQELRQGCKQHHHFPTSCFFPPGN